jgi:hypothetical protein
MRLATTCMLTLAAVVSDAPALAQGARYELFPEPDVRQTANNRTASAYVVDKNGNQFWVCTARYNYRDLTANNGDCARLDATVGRPSLTPAYTARAVTGSATINPLLPVVWFIEPTKGDVQFCDIRHAGLCVQISLP